MSERFEPTKHLRALKGKGGNADYLDVKWRLVWLRSEHPDAISEVQHIEISPDIAIFKATVSIPGGGSATDYGSETPRDFGDYIEKAATKALGRAVAQLGYGTQFVGFDLDENTRIVDSPVERKHGPDFEEDAASQPRSAAPARLPAPAPQTQHQPAEAQSVPFNQFPAQPPYAPVKAVAAEHAARAAEEALKANLLARIRDDDATPEFRLKALHTYYNGADSSEALDVRAAKVLDSGIPGDDLAKAYAWHTKRLTPPAPAAPTFASRAG